MFGLAIDADINSSLSIDDQEKATGNLACNHFFGSIELQDTRLRIPKIGSTRKYCQGPVNQVELLVTAVLSDWSEVQVTANTLTLMGSAHKLSYVIKQ